MKGISDSRRSKQKTSVIRGVKDSCPKTNGMVTEYAFKSSGEQDIHYNIISSPVDPQVTDDTKRKISRMKRDITSHKLSDISGKESDLIGRNVNENIANARTRKDENANAKSAKADKRKVNTDSSSLKSADHDSFGTEWGQKSIQKMHSCFPNWLRKRMKWIEPFNESERGQKWLKIRYAFMNFVDHSYFEWLALFIIFASSITLAFEDIYLYNKEKLKQTLNILNITFCVLFAFEMLLKFVAYGLTWYFTSFWCLLDFFVVTISFLGVLGDNLGLSHILAFRSVRTLRAIRPLRAISRWQGMKIVVNSLMRAIPAIIHVILVGIVFWLAFSIIGVQLFSGRFYKCINETTGKIFSPKIIPNRNVCEDLGQTWENSKINFDHVAAGLLALFQVATFEGWMEVMRDAVDATEIDHQPAFENNTPAYLYFVVFIVFGSFFTLNLFISVIIDNFHVLKKKYEGSYLDILLTDGQRNYYNTLKRLGGKKPQKTIKMPKSPFLKFFYRLTLSKQFEMAVVLLIFLNMIAMAVEHHEQSKTTAEVLSIINICITVVFGVEAILKLLGLRLHYFRVPWNIFDFTVLIMSVIDIVLEFLLKKVFIKPNLLRSIRLFRIGRVLRLVKALKGIRKLLFALIISLPAIFNIGALLFLIIYIYAIIGMSLFGDIKLNGALNEGTNFQTFSNAFVLLIRLSTSAGWNEILDGLLIEEPSCDPNYRTLPDGKKEKSPAGDCGVPWLAIPFMVSYIILVYLIIINMYIAVILENFNQAHQQEEVGITEEDFEMFYVVWERYDPNATQFIHVDQLSDFVADLEEPLKVEKPNEIALVSFDLPIMEGERIHCLDILMALINNLMSDIEQSHELLELKLKMQMKFAAIFPSRENYKVIATTLERKKEDVAARTLQRAWRSHKNQQSTSIVASIKTELLRRDTLADTHGSDLGNRFTNAVNFIFGSRSSKASFSASRDRSASQGIIFSRNRFLSRPSMGISGVAPQSRRVTQAAKCENTIDST